MRHFGHKRLNQTNAGMMTWLTGALSGDANFNPQTRHLKPADPV